MYSQKDIHELAKKKGFWETPNIPEKLALIHSEISEALEELRSNTPMFYYVNNKPEGTIVELADALIRLYDLAEYLGYDLNDVAAIKHEYNVTRPYKHGREF